MDLDPYYAIIASLVPYSGTFFVMLKTLPYLISLIVGLNYPTNLVLPDMVLTEKTISLEQRYPNKVINDVFKDNILLTLSYLDGDIKSKSEIKWVDIDEPQNYYFSLEPGQSFAFHDQSMKDYKNIVKTTNAHFNYQEGFKSDGLLVGDGVCHLASLMYWAAKDAGLSALAPTNHDFAKINEVPKVYGTSIYSLPGSFDISARQNLYITNNQNKTVVFVFVYDGTDLKLSILKLDTNNN